MNVKQATARYYKVLVPAMILFLGSSLGLAWIDKNVDVPGVALVALAAVPIVALLSMFWIHWRFMNEIDEFLRQIQVKALLAGAALVLAIATGWGYLESYADAPTMPIFWLNPIFWTAYGLSAIYFTKRAGVSLR
jgi:hypothetical protein